MVYQNEIDKELRDENGFIKILPFKIKDNAKGLDMLEAFRKFDKTLKNDAIENNISFNKHFYDVVATEKNKIIRGETPIANYKELYKYMENLREDILNNPQQFNKAMSDLRNEKGRIVVFAPKNQKQAEIANVFQNFYEKHIKTNPTPLKKEFYDSFSKQRNFHTRQESDPETINKYLTNTYNNLLKGAYNDNKFHTRQQESYAPSNNYNQQDRQGYSKQDYNKAGSNQGYGQRQYNKAEQDGYNNYNRSSNKDYGNNYGENSYYNQQKDTGNKKGYDNYQKQSRDFAAKQDGYAGIGNANYANNPNSTYDDNKVGKQSYAQQERKQQDYQPQQDSNQQKQQYRAYNKRR